MSAAIQYPCQMMDAKVFRIAKTTSHTSVKRKHVQREAETDSRKTEIDREIERDTQRKRDRGEGRETDRYCLVWGRQAGRQTDTDLLGAASLCSLT